MSADLRRFPFLTQAADRDRMPVVLVSGFLGSGKTTLVNALLRDPRLYGTAVAVNEFGPVPIDHELIEHGPDRTLVLANGCLCCNLAGDMESAMLRLFSRRDSDLIPRFRRLIVEPSGLAHPAPLAQAILRNPMMARILRLTAIVTVVDSQFGLAQLATHPETRKQAALADRLVLTKPDQAPPDATEALRAALLAINESAPILTAQHGAVDADLLLPADFLDPAAVGHLPAARRSSLQAYSVDPAHAARVESAALIADRPLDWRAFDAWLKPLRLHHADALLRLKGLLHIAGIAGPVVLHGIHHVLHNPVILDTWPSDDRRSRLVLIADPATIAIARESWTDALPRLYAD